MREIPEAAIDAGMHVVRTTERDGRAAVRELLEAADPLLGPRPLLDREAVRDVVALKAMFFRRGDDGRPVVGEYGQEPLANAVDAMMELARPMPTQEQIAEALDPVAFHQCKGDASYDNRRKLALQDAAAVLALLNGAG